MSLEFIQKVVCLTATLLMTQTNATAQDGSLSCSQENVELENRLIEVLHEQMCSQNCPCPQEAQSLVLKHQVQKESDVNLMHFVSADRRSFNSFEECWKDRLQHSSLFDESFKSFTEDYLKIVNEYETLMDCSTICMEQPGNFWFTKEFLKDVEKPELACKHEKDVDSELMVKLQSNPTTGKLVGNYSYTYMAQGNQYTGRTNSDGTVKQDKILQWLGVINSFVVISSQIQEAFDGFAEQRLFTYLGIKNTDTPQAEAVKNLIAVFVVVLSFGLFIIRHLGLMNY